MRPPFLRSKLAACVSVLALAGCALTPNPITDSDVRARLNQDQMRIYADQEQVFKPIGFEEAVARALKYNLDYRLKMMESALASGMANLSRYDLLPNLMTSAGYVSRDNITGSRSFSIQNDTAVDSTPYSYSGGVERRRSMAGAEFSWNILDFGMSYFRAKQQADQYLIAEERRRRVIQNVLQDVRSAYWRAVGAQRLARQAETLAERARTALAKSQQAELQGLLPPKEALTYQRLLLDAVQLLTARRQELEYAKRELAALMNITPGTEFQVVESEEPPLIDAPQNIAEMEELALINRPELREEDYRVRITANEARRQLASLIPSISVNVGAQYDSNKYLYNNHWTESSLRVNFNLFKALSMPAMSDVHEAQRKADDGRRQALSMAILTQVRVAVERYRLALHDLEIARDSATVDRKLADYARAALSTRAESELELIRAETRALNAEYQRNAAYANAQASFGRIYNSLGLEVVPENIQSNDVATLAKVIAEHVQTIEQDIFPKMLNKKAALPPLALQIELPQDAKLGAHPQEAVQQAVQRALERNQGALRAADKAGPKLLMRLSQEAPRDGVRGVYWDISLIREDGSVAGVTRYGSSLATDASPRALSAFAEAATVANLKNYIQWLQPAEDQ